jgi:hypothetical protein
MTTFRTLIDPILLELERCPYGPLARIAITPDSSARAVLDASFRLPPDQWSNRKITVPWDQLRNHRTRLVADFLLYELPAEAAAEQVDGSVRPVALPRELLADVEHDALTGYRAPGLEGPAAELPAMPAGKER